MLADILDNNETLNVQTKIEFLVWIDGPQFILIVAIKDDATMFVNAYI